MGTRLILLLLLLAPLAGFADEMEADITGVSEALREGKIDVGDMYSIDFKKGRYHVIHTDVLGVECASCHYGETYRQDYMLVGKDKPYAKRAKGRYDRTVCLGCHRVGGEGTAFYGSNAIAK